MIDVVRDALGLYRAFQVWNLNSLHATDAERELSALRIELIDEELAKRPETRKFKINN